ncbi:MAG: hypothetical protein R3325_00890 [Thermoanaerobaculia bacterium]|nr:hypothetical protein [Thermoanaerobaculia bacterium]
MSRLRAARAGYERLVGLDPSNAEWRQGLAYTLTTISRALAGSDASEAAGMARRAVEISEGLLAERPADPEAAWLCVHPVEMHQRPRPGLAAEGMAGEAGHRVEHLPGASERARCDVGPSQAEGQMGLGTSRTSAPWRRSGAAFAYTLSVETDDATSAT